MNDEYQRRHREVREMQGSAKLQRCSGDSEHCTEQAEGWATIHGTSGKDPMTDYLPLCIPCHVFYDRGSYQPPSKIQTRYSSGHYYWCARNCTRSHRKTT